MPTRSITPHPGVVLAVLALAVLLVAPSSAFAEAKVSISAPLLPLARADAIVPVHVDIAATDPIEGVIRVSFGNSEPGVARPYKVGRGSVRRVSVPVRLPDWTAGVRVEVQSGRKVLAKKTLETPPPSTGVDQLHIVAIGEDPLGLTLLREVAGTPVIGHPGCADERAVRVETLLPAQLPATWFAWTAVDLVVWRRPDPSRLSPEQQTALRQWVHSGGTLLVALGDNHRAWTSSPLGALSGVDVEPRDPSESAAVAVVGLGETAFDAPDPLPHLHLAPVRAWPRVTHDDATLVTSRWVGGGRVVTLGFDPAAGELRGVLDRETFWRNLLGLWPADSPLATEGRAGPHFKRAPAPCGSSGSSWSDTTSTRRQQFRDRVFAALGSFARANPLPLGTVLAFGLVYLLLIGPVDYFLGRRLGKPLLTWVTFPVIAIGFSVGAAVLITVRKAGDTEVRCVEVVDVFEGDVARGSGWCALWSDRRQDVTVEVARGAGVVRRAGGIADVDDVIQRETSEVLAEATRVGLAWRANQWAVSTWSNAWVDDLDGGFSAARDGDRLVVSNRSGIDLEEAWILQGGVVLPLGALPDGGTATAGPGVARRWAQLMDVDSSAGKPPPNDPFSMELDTLGAFDAPPVHWTAALNHLADPHTEHVGRLPASTAQAQLLGRAKAVGAPVPDLKSATLDTVAVVRVELPLPPEDTP